MERISDFCLGLFLGGMGAGLALAIFQAPGFVGFLVLSLMAWFLAALKELRADYD